MKDLRNHNVQFVGERKTNSSWKFESGATYATLANGALVNTSPKLFRSKKDRRAARQLMKELNK